ncbi:DUF1294 domain-containing protein [Flavobacterium sp. RS13.1]|jgi:uncharacterized membrane protein YsdA (DUF1294 family)|uniref:DUF1294 domain-containing protein n=1 Tax=Flavobacterium sp. RS13.1 TaxID=3400345 RepID=UPI003AB0FCE1
MKFLLLYFLIINFATLIIAGYDKYSATKNKRRTPENTLFSMALFGGSVGLLVAMLWFRHKTSKPFFILKFSAIVFIQLVIAVLIVVYDNNVASIPFLSR